MTDQLPEPEATIEVSSCRCQKSKCNSRRCAGRQNGLVCTEMRGHSDRKNELKDYMIEYMRKIINH